MATLVAIHDPLLATGKPLTVDAAQIVEFWSGAGPKRWFVKNAGFDAEIRARFEATHHAAARGDLGHWLGDAKGALALALLLDQFPRNLWRGSADAFATDPLARWTARQAIDAGHDRACATKLRSFFYLPFAHSELLADQDYGVRLWEALAREAGEDAKWAYLHRDIIASSPGSAAFRTATARSAARRAGRNRRSSTAAGSRAKAKESDETQLPRP
jgi:uncharacterized protein (DUF924 family)